MTHELITDQSRRSGNSSHLLLQRYHWESDRYNQIYFCLLAV